MLCQFCHAPLFANFTDFGRCSRCSLIYNLNAQATAYEDDYFGQEYEAQYGKSYVADKENIQRRMKIRLGLWQKLAHFSQVKSLLEIGSAAGFFLELTQKAGIKSTGWEVSKHMSDYANQQGLTTETGDFFSLYQNWQNQGQKPFSAIAAFYVIEHFNNQSGLWQALKNLIEPGGYLLLAVPSSFGPTYYFSPSKWADTHPQDHFVDYSPLSLKRIGKGHGFTLIHSSAEGIHPARFIFGENTSLHRFYGKVQKTFAFSDTIFTILKKKK